MSNQEERTARQVRVEERVTITPAARAQPVRPAPLVIRFVPWSDPADPAQTTARKPVLAPADLGPWEDRT